MRRPRTRRVNAGATACIAFNDLLAIGMLDRLRERGVSVPDDLSIVGCDDIFGADFCHPPLTTLTAPIELAGRTAVSMLLRSPRRPRAAPVPRRGAMLPTHLTIRSSTGTEGWDRHAPVTRAASVAERADADHRARARRQLGGELLHVLRR